MDCNGDRVGPGNERVIIQIPLDSIIFRWAIIQIPLYLDGHGIRKDMFVGMDTDMFVASCSRRRELARFWHYESTRGGPNGMSNAWDSIALCSSGGACESSCAFGTKKQGL